MVQADIKRWREDWYLWRRGTPAWEQRSREWMKAEAGRWLDEMGLSHTQTGKGNLVEAILTRTFLEDGVRPPCWVGGGARAREAEGRAGHIYISMANGILDVDDWLVNGELGSGEYEADGSYHGALLPHHEDFWTRCGLPYAFDPEALCPKFEQALALWQPTEEGRIILQNWAGYCFVPGHPEQVFLLNLGPGGDGKSQWAAILTALVGAANVSSSGLEAFDPRKDFGLEPLLGKSLNITADANDLDRVGEGVMKAIVGGDAVTVNRKHKSAIHEALPCKFMLNANQLPSFRDRSEGIWRRMLLLHWEPVPAEQRVKDYGAALVTEEVQGIFNWMLCGLHRVRKEGFNVDRAGELYRNVVEARAEVQKERQFFEECIGWDPKMSVEASKVQITEAYERWCKENLVKRGLYGDNLIKALLRWLAETQPNHAEAIREKCSVQRRVVEGDDGSRKRRFYRGIYILREALRDDDKG